jgi:hypothetical protein
MGRNPAEVRGDIQRGVTGDKRAGFDPAVAPLETDAEAAGTPLPPAYLDGPSATTPPGHAADAYASAMRSTGTLRKDKRPTPALLFMLGFMIVIITGAVLAAVLR